MQGRITKVLNMKPPEVRKLFSVPLSSANSHHCKVCRNLECGYCTSMLIMNGGRGGSMCGGILSVDVIRLPTLIFAYCGERRGGGMYLSL